MGQSLLDVASAAEIMGVDSSIVLGWCNNHIINCQSAPEEYSDKTKYLIREDECDYVGNLIKKFGVRGALLNYNKSWKISVPKIPEQHRVPKPVISDIHLDNIPTEIPNDKLVTYILYTHELKEKIKDFKQEVYKLESEYEKIRESIVAQL